MTQIHQLLKKSTVRVGLPGTTKEDVLEGLIDLVAEEPGVINLDNVRAAVFEREQKMSTGVGKGLALPHAKTAAVSQTVAAFAVTAEPVPFGAIDDEPVRLMFLLVGTDQAKSQHIKILSRISRLMNRDEVRRRLLDASTPETILQVFEQAEAQLLEQ